MAAASMQHIVILAMTNTLLAGAGHVVSEQGDARQVALDHRAEVGKDQWPLHGTIENSVGQRRSLVRSERPTSKIIPDRHRHRREEPSRGRFPDDDAEHPAPQAAQSSASQPEADAGTEVRQLIQGTTPAAYISVGTPEKNVYMILDTGSDKFVAKTWSSIQSELRQVDGGIDNSVEPSTTVYNRDTSSTYVRLYTNSSDGPFQELYGQEKKNTGPRPKQGFIAYGSGIAITDEGQDTVKIGGRSLTEFPISEIVKDQLSMLHTKQGVAGILGLQHMKNKSMGESVFTRARSKGSMYAFGFCRGDNNSGTFIWGDKATDGHKLPVLGQIHWAVTLGKVKMVSGQPADALEQRTETTVDGDTDVVKHGNAKRIRQHQMPTFPFRRSVGGDDGLDGFGGIGIKDEEPMMPVSPHRSSLAQKDDPNADVSSSNGLADDPELKQEIGKIVGDIIGKVVEKIEKKKGGHADKENTAEVSSNVFCGEDEKCTAILDTGSNIIAGPSDGIKELAKFAKVNPDCSNFDKLPDLHLSLGGDGDFKAVLPPKAYVMQVKLPPGATMGDMGGDGDPMGDMGGDDGGMGADGSGGGMDGMGGGGGMDSMGGMDGMSGMDGLSLHRSKKVRAWYKLVKTLHAQRGVDLSHAMHGVSIRDLMHNDQLCMPALVPLDAKTAIGKLWVVGTPLFEQYYARWSWGKDEEAPSVFLADKHVAKACVDTAAQTSSSLSEASAPAVAKESSGLLRRQQPGKPLEFLDKTTGVQQRPALRDITDIRYPYWAKALSGV